MSKLTWDEKYSRKTTDIYVRLNVAGMIGFGFIIISLLVGLATRPRFTDAFVVPWVVIGVFMSAAAACGVVMCVLLGRFFASARLDRRRRHAGLPVDPAAQGRGSLAQKTLES